jgi:hypothetical protein
MTTYLLAPHLFPAFQKLYVGTIVAFQFYSTAAKQLGRAPIAGRWVIRRRMDGCSGTR